jgi:hypothetical protein
MFGANNFFGYPDDAGGGAREPRRSVDGNAVGATSTAHAGSRRDHIPRFLRQAQPSPPAPAPSIEREIATLLAEQGYTPYSDPPGPVRDRNRNVIRRALAKFRSLYADPPRVKQRFYDRADRPGPVFAQGPVAAGVGYDAISHSERDYIDIFRSDDYQRNVESLNRFVPGRYRTEPTPRHNADAAAVWKAVMIEQPEIDTFVTKVRDLVMELAAGKTEIEQLKATLALRDTQIAESNNERDRLVHQLDNIHKALHPEPAPNV